MGTIYRNNCHYCKHWLNEISQAPCYTCKVISGSDVSHWEQRTEYKVCSYCKHCEIDQDQEPCDSCGPGEESNWEPDDELV